MFPKPFRIFAIFSKICTVSPFWCVCCVFRYGCLIPNFAIKKFLMKWISPSWWRGTPKDDDDGCKQLSDRWLVKRCLWLCEHHVSLQLRRVLPHPPGDIRVLAHTKSISFWEAYHCQTQKPPPTTTQRISKFYTSRLWWVSRNLLISIGFCTCHLQIGWTHVCVSALILRKYGPEVLEEIL